MFLRPPTSLQQRNRARPLVIAFGGTRPEAIKLAPLAVAARNQSKFDFRIVFSGQQPDMFFQTLACFGVHADRATQASTSTEARSLSAIRASARLHIEATQPDLVLVQGDTNTALACAEAAHSLQVDIGHVEAGLRSGDPARPFPEEPNRRTIGQLARIHFAPCEQARDNLVAEDAPGVIVVTGNPVIDALMMFADRPLKVAQHDILFTCHRRENFGLAAQHIATEVCRLAEAGFRVLLPIHTNPGVALPLRAMLQGRQNVEIMGSLPYPSMIDMLRSVRLVISDSGGLQEECAALGTPMLLLREETERPEVVRSGICQLVGSAPNQLAKQALHILRDPDAHRKMRCPTFPYGKGNAANQILDIIAKHLAASLTKCGSIDTKLALAR